MLKKKSTAKPWNLFFSFGVKLLSNTKTSKGTIKSCIFESQVGRYSGITKEKSRSDESLVVNSVRTC